jgi:phenylalanyl-tRNA synthetase beta chain
VKFSLKWLADYVDIDVDVERLAHLLSHSGTKVESIDQPGAEIRGVVVAEVLSMVDHPNATKLTLVDVLTPEGEQRVVCGARNFAVGDRVPLATVGAVLPGGFEITERKIRGEVSRGMLCSGMELGLSADHSGILVLPPDSDIGDDVVVTLGLDDAVFDLEVTPNRGDCMGMIGIAREVAALLGNELRLPDDAVKTEDDLAPPVSVTVEDAAACPRYLARYIGSVRIEPAPSWLQARLLAVGVRPISNVVDATNYVMVETGQPLHAFDASNVHEHSIVVRRARPDEKLTTLDGTARTMHPDDLLIADPRRCLAIAGVMGGEDSEVSDSTTSVILESAAFDAASIAYTSRRHRLRSEASARFERRTDPEFIPFAAARACRLMSDHAAGRVASEVADAYPAPRERIELTLRPDRTSAILGYPIPAEEQVGYLRALRIEVVAVGDRLRVTVPSFRPDLEREIDIIEEVGRLAGFDRLPTTLPPGVSGSLEPDQAAERRLRRTLAGFGLSEAWTSSFGSPVELDMLGLPDDHPARRMVELANPTADYDPVLRTSLLPGLLRSVARNAAQHAESIALFELARIYEPTHKPLPQETLVLGAVFAGARGAKDWRRDPGVWDFFGAKGVLQSALAAMEIEPAEFASLKGMPFHRTRASSISIRGTRLGAIGELHPNVCERFDVPEGAVAFEVAVAGLLAAAPGRAKVEELSRFPAVYMDLAVVVNEGVAAGKVEEVVRGAGAPDVTSVRLFDVYTGDQVPEGKKSLAFALELRSHERTLSDEDAEAVRDRILRALEERTGATLRT